VSTIEKEVGCKNFSDVPPRSCRCFPCLAQYPSGIRPAVMATTDARGLSSCNPLLISQSRPDLFKSVIRNPSQNSYSTTLPVPKPLSCRYPFFLWRNGFNGGLDIWRAGTRHPPKFTPHVFFSPKYRLPVVNGTSVDALPPLSPRTGGPDPWSLTGDHSPPVPHCSPIPLSLSAWDSPFSPSSYFLCLGVLIVPEDVKTCDNGLPGRRFFNVSPNSIITFFERFLMRTAVILCTSDYACWFVGVLFLPASPGPVLLRGGRRRRQTPSNSSGGPFGPLLFLCFPLYRLGSTGGRRPRQFFPLSSLFFIILFSSHCSY